MFVDMNFFKNLFEIVKKYKWLERAKMSVILIYRRHYFSVCIEQQSFNFASFYHYLPALGEDPNSSTSVKVILPTLFV